jgi:GNAT superfamily N-acetyltransferase
MEWRREGFTISTDPGRLDMALTVDYLAQTYWGRGTDKDRIRRSIENAIVFGLYATDGGQVGFCRVVTDHARFAWLSDVFVLDRARGLGLGKWLVACAVDHPDLAGLSRFILATADAHGLYRQFGFEALVDPDNFMMKS